MEKITTGSCLRHTPLRGNLIHTCTKTYFLWAISKVFFILSALFLSSVVPLSFFLAFVVLMPLMLLYSLSFFCLFYCQISHALSLNTLELTTTSNKHSKKYSILFPSTPRVSLSFLCPFLSPLTCTFFHHFVFILSFLYSRPPFFNHPQLFLNYCYPTFLSTISASHTSPQPLFPSLLLFSPHI